MEAEGTVEGRETVDGEHRRPTHAQGDSLETQPFLLGKRASSLSR